MDLLGDTRYGSALATPVQTCPRCGNFAALTQQLGRALCAACWERVIDPGLTLRQVFGDVRRLSARLLLPSWLALILINLPATAGGAFYLLSTGRSLPTSVANLYFFVTLIAVGAILHASHQVLMGDARVAWGDAWRASMNRWSGLAGSTWLSGLITLVFMLLLVVPGLMRAMSYALTTPIALHEGWTVSETLQQSTARVRGRRWKIFGIGLAVSTIAFLPALVLLMGFGAALGFASDGELSAHAEVVIDVVADLAMSGPLAVFYFLTASLYARCTVVHGGPGSPQPPARFDQARFDLGA